MSSVDIRSEVHIQRPVEFVAGYATDPGNAPAWYDNIRSVEWRTDPPLRVGTVVSFVASFLGRRLAYDYEVVEHDPSRRFVMRTSEGPFPMETSYEFEPSGSGTRMVLRNRGTPTGFSRLAGALLRPAMRRANRKDLAKLKAILEAVEPTSSA